MNITWVIRSRRLRWAVPVAHMWRGEVHTGFWFGSLREGDHLKDRDTDGRIILKLTFEMWGCGAWTGSVWLRIGTGDGLL
jgi:hypothetical protein